jgi:hypothetical protein
VLPYLILVESPPLDKKKEEREEDGNGQYNVSFVSDVLD